MLVFSHFIVTHKIYCVTLLWIDLLRTGKKDGWLYAVKICGHNMENAERSSKEVTLMAGRELQIYGQAEPFRIRPYEHHAKYYETDQMGIIHHSNYIRWMEEARMDLMEQIGLSYKGMEGMEIISPVLSVSCEYKSMVHFDDTVVIEAKIAEYDGIRMKMEYRMTDKKTGELRTLAASEHCFLNRSGKPISLKRSYPELDTKFFEFYEETENG